MGKARLIAMEMLNEVSLDLADSAAMSFAFTEVAAHIMVDVKGEVMGFSCEPDNHKLILTSNSMADIVLRYSKDLKEFIVCTEYRDTERFAEFADSVESEAATVVSFVVASSLINIRLWADFVKKLRGDANMSAIEKLVCLCRAY